MGIDNKNRSRATSITFATILVMIGLVFSKASGFVRDVCVGHFFNESYRDAYTLAFTIPDMVYNLLIGGSIQAAITPSLAKSISEGREKEGIRAVSIFISVFSLIMLTICTICVIFAEPIFQIYSSSKSTNPETIRLAARASQMLFPQIFFMMLAALCIGILNAYKRFASTSFGPTIYNIFVLLSIILFAGNSQKNLVFTTGGIMVAAIIYFIFQYSIGFDVLRKFRFIFKPKDVEFLGLVKKAIPILISASIVQINMVVLNNFAVSSGNDGMVFLLRNASTIWQLPYGIFAVAIGNVMLPNLSALYGSRKYDDASKLLSSRLRTALFMTIPSAGLVFFMSKDVVRAIYQWSSRYTEDNVSGAAILLTGYALAIITQSVVFIMNQAFYAIGKTTVPLIAGVTSLITNPLFCIILMRFDLGLISLTIAYSTTSVIQMVLLCVIYCKDKRISPRGLTPFIAKSTLCLCFMIPMMLLLNKFLPIGDTKIIQLIILCVKGLLSVGIYFVCALVLKMEEAKYWTNKVMSKFVRKNNVN